MDIHWNAVIQGTMTGLVGAAVLAVLVGGRNRLRNELLRWRIQRKLNRINVGSGLAGITTSVANETGRDMVVRQIAFLMGETYVVLLPSGELTSSYKGQGRKPTRAEMRRLKRGEMIQMESEVQFGSWKVPPDKAGFVALSPYTKTSFVLPAQFIADSVDTIQSIRIVLEYTTRTGDKKILQHEVRPRNAQHVQNTLNHFHEELRNGNLNKARRMFQMPEVTVKPKADDGSPVDPPIARRTS
jgi:hypothetical protein